MAAPRKSVTVGSNPARNATNVQGGPNTNATKPLRQRIIDSSALRGVMSSGDDGDKSKIIGSPARRVKSTSESVLSQIPVRDKDAGQSSPLAANRPQGKNTHKAVD